MPLKLYGTKKTIRNIVGIAAGKGGVGKSSLTANLALALKKSGWKVGVLDADLYGPSIPTMLPEDQAPFQLQDRLMPALSCGISVMSMGYFKSKEQGAVIRAPIASRLINQFLNHVDWGELDYLLIDFPPGTGDIQITLSQEARLTSALIVTTPQEIALMDVRKCIDMFRQVHIPIAGIVENMSYFQAIGSQEKIYLFGKGGGTKLADEYQIPFLGEIPIDPLMRECLDAGKSIFLSDSPSKGCFLELAEKIHECHKTLATGFGSFELIWENLPLGQEACEEVRLKSSDYKPEIAAIEQRSENTLAIRWTDGSYIHYPLSKLQGHCPCAGCASKKVEPEKSVQAVKLKSVGRYAIRIDFTSGCSKGIYDYDLLYKFEG